MLDSLVPSGVVWCDSEGFPSWSSPVEGGFEVHTKNLLKWGENDSGALILWEAVGLADSWSIYVTSINGPWRKYAMSAIDFMDSFMQRRLDCEYLVSEDWPDGDSSIHSI
ncbi:hypothetical protein [Nocardiopsis protaetiae]|uniref:hypothetical protein n=1 Tax=Nocardiopsis protaetiae TaxID=3382270 RepID=UPI00387ADC65